MADSTVEVDQSEQCRVQRRDEDVGELLQHLAEQRNAGQRRRNGRGDAVHERELDDEEDQEDPTDSTEAALGQGSRPAQRLHTRLAVDDHRLQPDRPDEGQVDTRNDAEHVAEDHRAAEQEPGPEQAAEQPERPAEGVPHRERSTLVGVGRRKGERTVLDHRRQAEQEEEEHQTAHGRETGARRPTHGHLLGEIAEQQLTAHDRNARDRGDGQERTQVVAVEREGSVEDFGKRAGLQLVAHADIPPGDFGGFAA